MNPIGRDLYGLLLLAVVCRLVFHSRPAEADPCGMVPPITENNDDGIKRINKQKSYIFHRKGMETMLYDRALKEVWRSLVCSGHFRNLPPLGRYRTTFFSILPLRSILPGDDCRV